MSEEETTETKPKKTRKTTARKTKKSTKEAEAKEETKETKTAKKTRAPRTKKAPSRKKKAEAAEEKDAGAKKAEEVVEKREPKPKKTQTRSVEPAPVVEEHVDAPPIVKLKYRKGTSSYAHMRSFRKKAYREALGRTEWERLIKWRKEGTITPVDHPTRIDRARALGYKAKQGVKVVRIKVRRGGLRKRKISKGRRARRKGILKITMNKSIQRIGEERVQKHYPNMEVLNSYQVGQDGMHIWYEVILVDPYNPSVLSDKNLSWVSDPAHSSRAYRGLTSAGKQGRGLLWKGKGAEKVRPSIRAHDRKGK